MSHGFSCQETSKHIPSYSMHSTAKKPSIGTGSKRRCARSKASWKLAPSSPAQDEAKNLVGRINNLVTTDMSNIVWGLHTIREVVYTPLNVIFCIGFLYVVLGWSY
ncbi:hypothetical protein BDZ89DRAFT_373119 [Hymenopellis radicata]|nr:hypothetical protein BDZ89DRAFT_373119 [Hymenopellis radicata]